MNRGSAALLDELIAEDLASMRPRFMNRGSILFPFENLTVDHRFNEAPIHESGKWARLETR